MSTPEVTPPADPMPDDDHISTTAASHLAYEVRLLSQRIDYVEKAIALQAVEYARRLDDLNHAHEDAVAKELRNEQTYVRQEVYDYAYRDLHTTVQETRDMVRTMNTGRATWAAAGALLLSVLALGLTAWRVLA